MMKLITDGGVFNTMRFLVLYLGIIITTVRSTTTYLVGFKSEEIDQVLNSINLVMGGLAKELPLLGLTTSPAVMSKMLMFGDTGIGIFRASEVGNVAELLSVPGVKFVERDAKLVATSLMVQEEPPSYGLNRISSRGVIPERGYVYDSAAGEGVDVYVLDSGINTRHADFGGRAFFSKNFVVKEEGTDLFGHGTHVAGTVAGTKFGVAKRARVFGVKILDHKGEGTISLAVQAIAHVIDAARATQRRSIINLSLAGTFSHSLNIAADHAASRSGIPVIAAAGNQHHNACLSSPASAFNVMAVGNVDSADRISRTSNFGPCVTIFAPGARIVSASNRGSTGSRVLSGTSMAAPHVAGVAALFWSQDPTLDYNQLYALIKQRATRDIISGLPLLTPNLMVYNQL